MINNALFIRDWRVIVGTLDVGSMDVGFEVKRTLRPEPNTANLKLYNLSPTHRRAIAQSASNSLVQKGVVKLPVSIQAGYKNQPLAQLYLGEMRASFSVTDGPDIITELSTGDGETAMTTTRMNVAFGPGTPIEIVIREIAATLGVGPGNIQQAVNTLQAKGLLTWSVKSTVLKGNAADHMTDACKSLGLEWSIQGGAIQILALGQPLIGQAVLLNSDTGLVGSPSVDSKGVLSFTSLLIPGIRPGVIVQMDSEEVKGGFKVTAADASGDTMSDEWYWKCSAEKY